MWRRRPCLRKQTLGLPFFSVSSVLSVVKSPLITNLIMEELPRRKIMSDAAPAPKKKGKLPIILALALVLGGGVFFMMKGEGKKEKESPALVLAEKETELEE